MIQQPDVAARVGIEALTDDFPVFQKAQGDRHSPINRSLIGCRPIGDDSLLQFVLSFERVLSRSRSTKARRRHSTCDLLKSEFKAVFVICCSMYAASIP